MERTQSQVFKKWEQRNFRMKTSFALSSFSRFLLLCIYILYVNEPSIQEPLDLSEQLHPNELPNLHEPLHLSDPPAIPSWATTHPWATTPSWVTNRHEPQLLYEPRHLHESPHLHESQLLYEPRHTFMSHHTSMSHYIFMSHHISKEPPWKGLWFTGLTSCRCMRCMWRATHSKYSTMHSHITGDSRYIHMLH